MSAWRIDPLALAKELIACPSETPHEGGALDTLENLLTAHGFICDRLRFEDRGTPAVDNLYARCRAQGRNLCFAGHTDVVPTGPLTQWTTSPFEPTVRDGILYGRGAVDMKGAIACFAAAAIQFLNDHGRDFKDSISFLLTNDEEGPAINGTRKVLTWLQKKGEHLDACLIGEPSSHHALGDNVSIGHRGSLNTRITIQGHQGHVAFPDHACNPIPRMLQFLTTLTANPLDNGNENFEPSNLEITTIDTGNAAENMIPSVLQAGFNIRFNTCHKGTELETWIHETAQQTAGSHTLSTRISGEPYLTPVGPLGQSLIAAITQTTGKAPRQSTDGGTSDGRFIARHCSDVIEFGLLRGPAHQIDEHVAVDDLEKLTQIYYAALKGYFGHE